MAIARTSTRLDAIVAGTACALVTLGLMAAPGQPDRPVPPRVDIAAVALQAAATSWYAAPDLQPEESALKRPEPAFATIDGTSWLAPLMLFSGDGRTDPGWALRGLMFAPLWYGAFPITLFTSAAIAIFGQFPPGGFFPGWGFGPYSPLETVLATAALFVGLPPALIAGGLVSLLSPRAASAAAIPPPAARPGSPAPAAQTSPATAGAGAGVSPAPAVTRSPAERSKRSTRRERAGTARPATSGRPAARGADKTGAELRRTGSSRRPIAGTSARAAVSPGPREK